MIERPTVLVLGAGASIPFGFPSGHALLKEVIRGLGSPGGPMFQILLDICRDERLIREFRRALTLARTASIDVLVQGRPEFLTVGKAAIACGLIPCEKHAENQLFDVQQHSWYDDLLNRLATGSKDDFRKNRLSIVTFNYDRSLEHYLFVALKHRWNLDGAACLDLVKTVPIVHMYGQLGQLPEDAGANTAPARRYGGDLDLDGVQQAVAEMQILHEGNSSTNLARAQELLKRADRVLFLGFGYHPTNLERLKVTELKDRNVSGSAYGLESGEQHAVRTAFGSVRIELGSMTDDVKAYLRKTYLDG